LAVRGDEREKKKKKKKRRQRFLPGMVVPLFRVFQKVEEYLTYAAMLHYARHGSCSNLPWLFPQKNLRIMIRGCVVMLISLN
jgi:hypothetical protein